MVEYEYQYLQGVIYAVPLTYYWTAVFIGRQPRGVF
jgi:hypothetical protein